MPRTSYQALIRQAVDLHVHVGPEIIPRKFSVPELQNEETGKIRAIGIKNHFFPTIAMDEDSSPDKPIIIRSVTLNHYVGGFNARLIRASAELSPNPIIVWFPTIHSICGLSHQAYEIPEEWIDTKHRSEIQLQPTKCIPPLTILDANGNIRPDVLEVLEVIKEKGCILATGHLTWQESIILLERATSMEMTRMIITHPIYQKIDMPLEEQKRLASYGAFTEVCYSMHAIDKIPMKKLAEEIRTVGAEHCILSSDVGQKFSPSPSAALKIFCELLEQEGIRYDELKTMLVKNPSNLILP